MNYLRNKFTFITQSKLNELAFYGKIVKGEPYLVLDKNLVAIGLNTFSYGTLVLTDISIPIDIDYRGYVIAGCSNDENLLDSIEVLYFSSETLSNVSIYTHNKKAGHCGISSYEKGYWCGGYRLEEPMFLNDIETLTFSTNNVSILGTTLSRAKNNLTGLSSEIKGYWCGGYVGDGIVSTIDFIQFNDESILNTLVTLSNSLCFYTSISTLDKKTGYVFGGYTLVSNLMNNITKLMFPTETLSSVTSTLSYPCADGAGIASKEYGYICGGFGEEVYSSIEKFTYSTEIISSSLLSLSVPRTSLESTSSNVKGYCIGGYDNTYHSVGSYDIIDGINFSNDAYFILDSHLSIARDSFTSVTYFN